MKKLFVLNYTSLNEGSSMWCSLDCFGGASAYCYGSLRKVTDVDILVKGVDLENVRAVLRDVEGVDMVTGISASAF